MRGTCQVLMPSMRLYSGPWARGVVDNGRAARVPVCDKHLGLLQATPK
jgi:hypothetical protein